MSHSIMDSRSRWIPGGAGGWGLLLPLLVLGAGCGTQAPRPPVPIDCDAVNAYEFRNPIETYEDGTSSWYGAPDLTGWREVQAEADVMDGGADAANGVADAALERVPVGNTLALAPNPPRVLPIENGGRCGSLHAMVLEASGNHDWGGLWGNWKYADTDAGGLDASGWEGVSFWARSKGVTDAGVPFPTDPSFTMVLSDGHTTSGVDGGCVDADSGITNLCFQDQTTGMWVCPSGATLNACGNTFNRPVVLTSDWQLYLLPFSSFYQNPGANRSTTGIDPTAIYLMVIRPPKEAVSMIWIDDLTLYRSKRSDSDQ